MRGFGLTQDSSHSALERFVVSFAVVAAFFGVLVAAAHPQAVAIAAGSGIGALTLRRLYVAVQRRESTLEEVKPTDPSSANRTLQP